MTNRPAPLALFLAVVLFSSAAYAQQSEGSLLLSLRKATTNWNDLSHENGIQGWSDVSSVCSWTGISCSPSGAVTKLELPCNACPVQAIGGLPGEIANLTSLETMYGPIVRAGVLIAVLDKLNSDVRPLLDLAGHLFSGPLPAGWSDLGELVSMNLSSNRMTDVIPASWAGLDTFPRLQLLGLAGNQLSGLLPDDLHMPALRELHLEFNILAGPLPATWSGSGLQELTGLFLSSNNFSGSLPELWGLAGAFPSLQELDINDNVLTGSLPSAWGSALAFQSLQVLQLSSNTLAGSLPDTWADPAAFPSLTALTMDNNTLSGPLPPAWGQLAGLGNLTTLNLANNGLSATLPPSWASPDAFPSLATLYLDINHLEGTLPGQWGARGAFPKLTCLSMVYNKLSGQLPGDWAQAGALPELQELWLSANQLSGMLPTTWGSASGLASLTDVRLDWNRLTGSIPSSWADFRHLQTLSVRPGNYYLCGALPAGAQFQLCKLVDSSCTPLDDLGGLCKNNYAASPPLPGSPSRSSSLQVILRIEGVSPQIPEPMLKTALQSALARTVPAADPLLIIVVDVQQVAAAPALHPSLPERPSAGRRLMDFAPSVNLPAVQMGRVLLQQIGTQAPVEVTVQMTAAANGTLADMESQLTAAVAGRELLSLLNDLMVPAASLDLVDAVPFNAATTPPSADPSTTIGSPASPPATRSRKTWELALEIILPIVTALLAAATLIYLFRHRVWCSVKNRFSPSSTPKQTHDASSPLKDNAADAPASGSPLQPYSGIHSHAGNLESSVPLPAFTDSGPYASLYLSPFEQASLSSQQPGAAGTLLGHMPTNDSLPAWFSRHSAGLQHEPSRDSLGEGAGSHSGPLPVCRREAGPDGQEGGKALQMTTSRSMPSLRDAECNMPSSPPSTSAHGQVPGLGHWDPQVLWELAQQTSAANNGYAPVRSSSSWRNGDSPLLARGTGPGRPASLRGPYSETLIHSIQTAIHAASNSSAGSAPSPDSNGHPLAHHQHRSSTPGGSTGSSDGSPLLPPVQEQSAGDGMRARRSREQGQGMFRLPSLPWSDWEIRESDIAVCKRPDGSDWELGGGAFGKVYKAMWGGSSIVAVKVLHETDEAADFGQEIAILRSCRHSNIVQFQGACVREGRVLLVTEFLPGGDLWHALGKPSVSRPIFAWHVWGHKVALDIARGLHFLHSRARPIAHFDLKSHNILLAADGTAKIADVGLARILNQEYVSKLDEVAGTFAWAAPELLLGRRCSEKVDIFAFGVVLWELASGERPQRGQMREIRVPEELPAEVNALMQRCLDVDPKQRPSAKQIFEDLSNAAQTQ